jgi:hypothetical protein
MVILHLNPTTILFQERTLANDVLGMALDGTTGEQNTQNWQFEAERKEGLSC